MTGLRRRTCCTNKRPWSEIAEQAVLATDAHAYDCSSGGRVPVSSDGSSQGLIVGMARFAIHQVVCSKSASAIFDQSVNFRIHDTPRHAWILSGDVVHGRLLA